MNYGEESKYKDIEYKEIEEFKEENLLEFHFIYSSKYSYIEAQTMEPTFLYEGDECFVWLNIEDKFIVIKNSPDKIIEKLREVFLNTYGITTLTPIKLNNELIKNIFGENINKISGVKANAGDDEAEKISILDPNFKDKPALQKVMEGREINTSNRDITLENDNKEEQEIFNTLGVNSQKGKLYLSKNVKASIFRKWSVSIIKKITKFMAENSNDFEIFKANNITSDNLLKEYKTKTIKEIIEEVVFHIQSKNHNITNFVTKIDKAEMLKYFYVKIATECHGCKDIAIPKCDCGNYGIDYKKNDTFICLECGASLDKVYCEEGHEIYINNSSKLLQWIPKKQLLDDVIKILNTKFNIEFKGYFWIHDENITIVEKTNGKLIDINDITEFKFINDLEIDVDENTQLLSRFANKEITEKCNKHNKINCDNCTGKDDICINKLFTVYGYRTSPHNGQEFGDMNFKVKYNNEEQRFVGIAKKYDKKFTSSSASAREMLHQVLRATQNRKINIIGAVCPSRFDEQFVSDLEYLAKCTESKIMILDDRFMVKQLKYYNETI